MSHELPTMEVVEIHYWAVLIKDQFRPKGEEWPTRYNTKEEAEAKLQRFRDLNLTRS